MLSNYAKVFINHMWTDNINQFGLLSYYCSIYKKVYFFAWIEVKELLEFYFKNINNIKIVYLNFKNDKYDINTYKIEEDNSPDILIHGHHDFNRNDIYKNAHNENNMSDRKNFVKFFYEGYGIPYIYRIQYFSIERNYELENEKYNEFINIHGDKYILYHVDIDLRNIDNNYKNVKCINLDRTTNIFFDYTKILENALEIHLRDSSWGGICYHLDTKYNLFKNKKIYLYPKRGYVSMFNEPIILENWIIDKLNDCLFVYCGDSMSCFINCLILMINLSKKYEYIYIYFNSVHFENACIYSKNFLKNIFNIRIINDNNLNIYHHDFKSYLNNLSNIDNKQIYEINNNYYYNYYDIVDKPFNFNQKYCIKDFYTNSFYINNIKKSDLYNISYIFDNEEILLNKIYYEKIINHLGKDYILIFNSAIHRNQDIFSFKFYHSEFNKNNYPLLYFTEFEKNNGEIYIKDILGEEKLLFYYFDIISNAKEIHFVNSFPANLYHYLFEIFKENFKNVEKFIYPNNVRGYNYNSDKNNITINNIFSHELIKFHNMNFVCPITYFSYNEKIIMDYNINSYNISYYSGDHIKIDKHIFKKLSIFSTFKNLSDLEKPIMLYLNKYIINLCYLNQLGVCYYNDIIKNNNFIKINIDNNTINENFNILNLDKDLDYFLKDTTINNNFIFLKSSKPFYLKINERELDDNYIVLSDNNIIINNNYNFIKLINTLLDNKKINYIFPYMDDTQLLYYEWIYFNQLHDPNN